MPRVTANRVQAPGTYWSEQLERYVEPLQAGWKPGVYRRLLLTQGYTPLEADDEVAEVVVLTAVERDRGA